MGEFARLRRRANFQKTNFFLPAPRVASDREKIICGTLQDQAIFRTEGHAGGGIPKDENSVEVDSGK